MLPSSYDSALVAASIIVAILASYTAVTMAGRVASSRGRAAMLWLTGGSFAMGFGIWSMHFVGMLAFQLPIELGYDITLTAVSLAMAIASSAFALWLVCQPLLPRRRLMAGAVLMGMGIAAMHYMGMAAMRMNPQIVYDPLLVIASVVIAIVAAGAALTIAFRLRSHGRRVLLARAGASLVMGCAIVGMHYTGMAAAGFPEGSYCGAANSGIDTQWLALLVIVVTLAVIAIALIISVLESRTALLASSLDRANDELVRMALHDNLTRLPNRVLLEDRLNQAIQKAQREERQFAVLFLDLDGFKAINDTYGHHTGDLLLIEVAHRIELCKRAEDTAARLGGDEFVVVIDIDDPDDAAACAQRLVEEISRPYRLNRLELRVSVSIGLALWPGNGANAHQLLVNADAAMYHAKEQGRDGYCFFEAAMNTAAHRQRQLVQQLRQALEREEFVLHFQPKMVAPAGPIIGVEALLRWQHPERGVVPPADFLPLAERTGLIVPIGTWVIREACRQMRRLVDQGFTDLTVAVNLSTVQLTHASLVADVRAALADFRLDARHLVLEITESTAMRDAETSLAILRQLAALGVGISLDDFGTGYSSLLYLKRLPANELKIDRGFVTQLVDGNEDEAIISAIIALGKTLDMNIVAEGVESPDQQALLTSLGCDTLQGYLLGHPMPADQLLTMLHEESAATSAIH
ncbi:MAG: EAL domain-containing protein [Spongiibacteraceae bacterium]|jgi:diguanylate cyclase (GGDEF)-like protein|nr:EAL domain-containing protein [Spongiibacteraceae bacterium]